MTPLAWPVRAAVTLSVNQIARERRPLRFECAFGRVLSHVGAIVAKRLRNRLLPFTIVLTPSHKGSTMLRSIALATAAIVISIFVVPATAHTAHAAATGGPSITFIGGTFTSRLSDEVGSPSQGWWSKAAHRLGASSTTVSAEYGSSMIARGNQCRGTTYGDRLRYLKRVDVIVVEAGSDEHLACATSGGTRYRATKGSERKKAIRAYLRRLGARVDALGIPRDHVFVVSPWGPKVGSRGKVARTWLSHYAVRANGFRYISTPRLKTNQTIDGAQPNARGHHLIGNQVVTKVRPFVASIKRFVKVPAVAPLGRGPSVLVVGDSISSWYSNDPGSPSQAWWSLLARGLGASSVKVSAEGGSGLSMTGNSCQGTSFRSRLRFVRAADILIVQGGRNDYKRCTVTDRTILATPAQTQAGIQAYVSALKTRVTQLGMRPDQVWFVSPWGTRDRAIGYQIQAYIRTAATGAGFHYVETPVLSTRLTSDGTHPSRAGSTLISSVMRTALSSAT